MALGSELDFGTNNFKNQKTLTQVETVTQLLINILMLKPGQMPGLPQLGMNIKQYIYKSQDEINTDFIKSEIRRQCSSLTPYINMDQLQVLVFPYKNESILYISIPFSVLIEGYGDKSLLLGYKKQNNSSEVSFNYKVSNAI